MATTADETIATPDLLGLIDPVTEIARAAGARIMEFYRSDMEVERKEDHTPVTDADHAADAIIVPALEALTPDIPVVSEERRHPPTGRLFWLVDPLDGTREFINHRDEFTVNIALVEDRAPVLGVVGIPVTETIYAAAVPGGAWRINGDGQRTDIAARAMPADGIVVAASRSHAKKDELDEFLADYAVAERIIAGSAIKFCYVAEGRADIYPRFGPTSEWDTAAGHAVIIAAGGDLKRLDGEPFLYGKDNYLNPGFVARGRQPG